MIAKLLLGKDVPRLSQYLQHIEPDKLSEMAMVDIAFEILKEANRPYHFRELMEIIADMRNMSQEQMMAMLAQVYTEINIDGRFVCVGENLWGLKRWYPTDSVEESQEGGVKKKKLLLDDDLDYDDDLEEDLIEDFDEENFEVDEDYIPDVDDDIDDELDEDLDEDLVEDEDIFEDEELEEEDSDEDLDTDEEDDF